MITTRRKILLGAGLGAASLFARPFERQLQAAGAAPKRFLVLYLPNCNMKSSWTPKGGRDPLGGSGDAQQFSLGSAYTALEPLKQKLVLIDGLISTQLGDAHGGSILTGLTGAGTRGDKAPTKIERNLAAKPSIDQVLLANAAGMKARVGSVHQCPDTRVRPDARPAARQISYGYDYVVNAPETQPEQTFARLFGNLAPGATPMARATNMDRSRALDGSVLDFVKFDLQRLNQRLAPAERQKLHQQLQGIRELELSLTEPVQAGNPATLLPTGIQGLKPNDSVNHKKMLDAQLGIVRAAFQLDVTRVATYMFGSCNSAVELGAFEAGMPKSGVHTLAHDDMDAPGSHSADLTNITTWYVKYIANFITQLDALRDVDGSSLLDNTLVALVTDVGQWHTHEDVPVVLLGGRGLGLKTGRLLRYKGRHVSDTFQSVAQLYGVDPALFGDPVRGYVKGPLPELV